MPTSHQEPLFSHPLHEVFSAARRAIQEEASVIPCARIGDAGLVRELIDRHIVPLPEFETTAKTADLDDQGEFATYWHTIKNPESFHYQPANPKAILHAYEAHLTDDELTLKFHAVTKPGATKQTHQQMADAIAANVESLCREIAPRNASLEEAAVQAIAARKTFCEELERRRKDLL
ncbi:MAG TPA: hypothetical protein VMB20_13740 [Candidatus Acidoferrum sp.]|nr:hypothetical protein [Candidatus Acidoferrum sp.]